MEINNSTLIGELVASDYKYAQVFFEQGIDFGCFGKRSIEEACKDKNVDTEAFIASLEEIKAKKSFINEDYANWPLDVLADYIQKTHHRFTDNQISLLKISLEELNEELKDEVPELEKIQELFLESAGDLASHMKKEELVLFPFIKKMMMSQFTKRELDVPHFGTVENPVNMMLHEHDDQGKILKQIEVLTNNYKTEYQHDALKNVYKQLQEFHWNMIKHIHLENNILFPKAVLLEKELSNQIKK